ncbi:unnamed protein product [Gulo gulo]|uniref:Translationally-controlled tumor protein n=1 Tax=Gulo gulo TaxID=48420 RepID=A0A9X9MAT9_GULGU|nr:unnamed protein product [Gulo gulo]
MTNKSNIDKVLIGENAFTEGLKDKGTQNTAISDVDIVMNHHLQETRFTKDIHEKYIKDYMKSVKGKLKEQRPERVKPFMTGAIGQIKHILANFTKYRFFIGEYMNPDNMVVIQNYNEDDVTPYMIYFKACLNVKICQHIWL